MILKANHYLKKSLISIIIPTHNSEATIKRCINSLTSQSYPRKKFDKIMCGEFLEHVEDPVGILTKLNQLLKDDGKIFLTAAVWAAHIDHIYLYNNAEEVRNHIRKAGFLIEKELVQASFEKDEADPEKSKIPVSYAAILSKN